MGTKNLWVMDRVLNLADVELDSKNVADIVIILNLYLHPSSQTPPERVPAF